MRIIGGDAKRREVKSPPESTGVRPILARVKKSLFDILQTKITGANFLDIFAGSGAVGIEALSRGAVFAAFVEQHPLCLHTLQENLCSLGFQKRSKVVRGDATKPFGSFAKPFDLIFMGPPYHDQKWNALHLTQPTLENIARCKYLKEGGYVIGQHHAKENPVDSPLWTLVRQEEYGDTRLSFFKQRSEDPAVT